MAEFVEVAKAKIRMCESCVSCSDCPLTIMNSGFYSCSRDCLVYPEKAQKIIMQWAKEHLVKTNANKFKEVFGFEVN